MSLHGGVSMTMSHVRSLFWIPHLRRLSKSVIRNCYVKNSVVYHTILQNQDLRRKIEVRGTDYAGPIHYKTNKKSELKHLSYYFLVV